MPVPQRLIDQITEDLEYGLTPAQVVAGLSRSSNYPDVARMVQEDLQYGLTPDRIVSGIWQARPSGGAKPDNEKDETPAWLQTLGSAVYDQTPGLPPMLGQKVYDVLPGGNLVRQGMRGLMESATFQAPKLIKQLTGYDIIPELPVNTTGEAIARGAGELGGFLVGPAAAAGKVVSRAASKILPTTVKGLLTKSIGKQAATLGLASAVTEHEGESLEENLKKRLVAGAKGAATGAVFGGVGMADIPGKPWLSRIGRFIAAEVGLDALQGKNPIEALMDDRPLAQKVFDGLLNAAFTWKPGTKLEVAQKRAEQIAVKLAEEAKLAGKQEAAFKGMLSAAAIRRQAQVDAELSDAERAGRVYTGGELVQPTEEPRITKVTPRPTIQALGGDVEQQLQAAIERGGAKRAEVIRREPNRTIEDRARLLSETKALPPGQGFELVGKPTGEVPKTPRKVVAANKKPFRTLDSANWALDASRKDGPTYRDRGYEVIPHEGGYALSRKGLRPNMPIADRLAVAIGKPDSPEATRTRRPGVTEDQIIKEIVEDTVTQKINMSRLAASKGKTELAMKLEAQARENADKLRMADGETTERAINDALQSSIPVPVVQPAVQVETKPQKTATLIGWVRARGGIWDKTLQGETRQFGAKESGVVGLVNKKTGLGFDELQAQAETEGILQPGQRLADALMADIAAVKGGRPRQTTRKTEVRKQEDEASAHWEIEEELHREAEKKGFEYYGKHHQETVGNLKPGDKLLISGEEYVHKGYDEAGNALLEDGEKFKVDPFERITAEAVKRAEENAPELRGMDEKDRRLMAQVKKENPEGYKQILRGNTAEQVRRHLAELSAKGRAPRRQEDVFEKKPDLFTPAKKKPSGETGGSSELSMLGTKQIADMARKAMKKWETGVEKEAGIKGKLLYEEMRERARVSAEKGEKIPKYAGSRNLERLDIPDEQKRMMMQTAEERGPKPKIPWTETIRMSKEEGKNYEQLKKKWEKVGAFNSRDITRARQLDVNAQATMRKALDAFPENPTAEDIVRFNQDVNTWKNEIDKVVDEASSEMGRGLNAHKIIMAPEEKLNRVVAKLNRELDAREIAMWRKVDPFNPEAIRRFEREVNRPELRDYFTEYWYNMILSGPSTQAVNFLSNVMWLAFNTTVGHAAKAMIDPFVSKLQGRPREYFMSEIIPMWAGMKKGVPRGKKLAGEVIWKGFTETGIHSKWDTEIGTMVGAFARSPNAVLRKIAPAVEMATRLLKAADVMAKTIAFDGKIEGLAERIARQEKLTGEAFVNRKAQLLSEVGDKQLSPMARRMIDKAADFSNAMTFNQEPGRIGEAILGARKKIHELTWVIPFVRTIGNLAKEGVKLTPGAGLLATKQGRTAIFHPITSGTAATDILAKQLVGTVISMAIAGQYEQGNITGDLPNNPAERDAWAREHKTPWSMRIGDGWYSYRKYEPFSWPIAATAIVMDTFKERGYKLSKGEETDMLNDITKAGLGVVRFWLDSGYLSGIADTISDIKESTRGGAEGLLKSSKRFALSWFPYSSLLRQTAEAIEGEIEGGVSVKQPKTIGQALRAQLPVLSMDKDIPHKLHVFGDEIKKPGGAVRQLLPWKWSEETKDPVDKELSRLQDKPDIDLANLGFPQKSIDGQKLTDGQYRDYIKLVGPKLKTRLRSVISAPGYKALQDKSRAKTLERIVKKIRSDAHDQFARTLGD